MLQAEIEQKNKQIADQARDMAQLRVVNTRYGAQVGELRTKKQEMDEEVRCYFYQTLARDLETYSFFLTDPRTQDVCGASASF